MDHRFEMPWDRSLRVTTALFVVLLLGVSGLVPWFALRAAQGDAGGLPAVLLVPALAVVLVLPLTWALAPRALFLGRGVLRIEWPLRPVEIPLTEVRSVVRLPRQALRGLVRTWGSGGAFGHYGRFWSRRLGAIRLYATRRDGYVAVDTDGGRYLVTPGDPEAFLAALLRAAPRARAAASPEALGPAPGGSVGWKAAPVAIGLVGLLVGGIFLFLWGWAPRSVRLEGSEVVVERNWAATVTIPLPPGGARPLGRDELRGFRKVAGTAIGDLRYGQFSSAALGRFQLHAPGRGPHWLLETPEGKVVVVPDDPAAFEVGVRARGRAGP